MFLACKGQEPENTKCNRFKTSAELKSSKDTIVFVAKKADTLDPKDSIVSNKKDNPVIKPKKINKPEPKLRDSVLVQKSDSTLIWSKDQVEFFETVDKVLLFHVRTTDIGSRKLDLDSELTVDSMNSLTTALLSASSYPVEIDEEFSNTKELFEPLYQILLEGKEEKLTLLFDPKSKNMLVASLNNRTKYKITDKLIDLIETFKIKE